MSKKPKFSKATCARIVERVKNGEGLKPIAKEMGEKPYQLYMSLQHHGFPNTTTGIRNGQSDSTQCTCGKTKNKRDEECIDCYSKLVAGRPLLIENIKVFIDG